MVAFIFLRMALTNFPRRDGRRFTPASFWEAQTNSKPAASQEFSAINRAF